MPRLKLKAKETKPAKEESQSSAISFATDDYIIVKHNGKPHLCLAIGPRRALLEKGVESDDTSVTIDVHREDVMANLGKNPVYGKVFGVNVEPYDRTVEIKDWPPLRIYRRGLTKQNRDILKSAMASVFANLSKHKTQGVLKRVAYLELRTNAGKWAGTYKKNRAKDESPVDVISLNCIPLDDKPYLEYVLTHEVSHGIWFHSVPKDVKGKWLNLYTKRITVNSFDEKRMKSLLKAVIGYDGSVTDYVKEMADEDETIILKEVIAYIKKVHKLDRNDLDLLHDSGNKDKLENLWPSITDIGTSNNDPTEYAMTNPKEFFAECLSLYLTGTKLSKDITIACEKTLENLQRIY